MSAVVVSCKVFQADIGNGTAAEGETVEATQRCESLDSAIRESATAGQVQDFQVGNSAMAVSPLSLIWRQYDSSSCRRLFMPARCRRPTSLICGGRARVVRRDSRASAPDRHR